MKPANPDSVALLPRGVKCIRDHVMHVADAMPTLAVGILTLLPGLPGLYPLI